MNEQIETQNNDVEFDSSDDIWKWYCAVYEWNLNDEKRSQKYWDITNPKSNNKARKKAVLTDEGLDKYGLRKFEYSKNNITISGDIVFNFSGGHHSKQFNKYSIILEDELKNNDSDNDYSETLRCYIGKLKECNEIYHHSKENCALLLSTGKLQHAKKGIGDDRGDTFIWALNEYFLGKSEILLNSATPQNVGILRAFLDSYIDLKQPEESIYRYCSEFYNIDNRELIDTIIRSGAKAIDTPKRLMEYIDIAFDFWRNRGEKMNSVSSK